MHEILTNKWYNLAEDTNVIVEWNETTNSTIENELRKAQVKVIKIDKDNNEIKLEGVKFEVLDENQKVLETIVTDKNGEALTSKYPVVINFSISSSVPLNLIIDKLFGKLNFNVLLFII